MVFSTNNAHIDENLVADSFVMSEDDYAQMTDFRPADLPLFDIDWEGQRIDDDIVAAAKAA